MSDKVTVNGINISKLEKRALCKRLNSSIPYIIITAGIIIVTAALVYFYPKFKDKDRLLFLINSVWPSGVIVILVPIWTAFLRDLRENIGYDLYLLLKECVSQMHTDSSKKNNLINYTDNHKKNLLSSDKTTRKKALEEIVNEINASFQS